mgnify:CR=1 FL=1
MNKFSFLLIIYFFCISCSQETNNKSVINEKSLDLQVLEAYQEGMNELENGDVLFAAKKFNEAEILFPQSKWAPKAALMAAYAYYSQDYYGDAIAELERFLKVYPKHKNKDYAYYLLAISHYEQIVDEKKDLFSILQARQYFEYLISNYPNTEYSVDASFKLELINDVLAAKEMYIGRYYIDRKKWIPAINRFKNVVNDYDTTIYIEEALYRLVEVYYLLGLKEESKKYAKLLGYNYESSKWYENSYALFNEKYEKKDRKKIKKEKNNNILKKIKSIFN